MLFIVPSNWLERFRPFTTFHFVVVAACAILIAAACIFGRKHVGTPAEWRLRFGWVVSILIFQVFASIWRLGPGQGAPDGDLPLHLCRVAPWVAVAALLTMHRALRAILYFWGLGLCFQGFVTPLRLNGAGSMDFWLFWIGHLQIVGSAVYDLVVHHFRPAWPDFRTALLASWAYALVVIPINLAIGSDYGYLGRAPAYKTRNIIDRFPPWPWRTLCMILLIHGWLTLYWIVWRTPRFVRRLRGLNPEAQPRAQATDPAPQAVSS